MSSFSVGQPAVDEFGLVKPPKITSLYDFSDQALQELRNWLNVNPPIVPVTNINGYLNQWVAQIDFVAPESAVTSTSYDDPASPIGPILTGLPDGEYVFLFGAAAIGISASNTRQFIGLQINGVNPSDDSESIEAQQDLHCSLAMANLQTLANDGNNTVKMVYRSTNGDSVDSSSRWLLALRVANP